MTEPEYTLFSGLESRRTDDGFTLYTISLADILNRMGIFHTGLSDKNPQDVQSYYDDWYLYSVTKSTTVYSLLKMREQEYDFVPGFADKDDPGVTISFVALDPEPLEALFTGSLPVEQALPAFVNAFRSVTEYLNVRHHPLLQEYFSSPYSKAAYLIADAYLQKLLSLVVDGRLPLPEKIAVAPDLVLARLETLNRQSPAPVCDMKNHCLFVADPANPTEEERYALLAAHTGNLTFNSFAAEVKFHADALISWQNLVPRLGKTMWYASAIRADMQIEKEEFIRKHLFSPYYTDSSHLIRQQEEIHGKR